MAQTTKTWRTIKTKTWYCFTISNSTYLRMKVDLGNITNLKYSVKYVQLVCFCWTYYEIIYQNRNISLHQSVFCVLSTPMFCGFDFSNICPVNPVLWIVAVYYWMWHWTCNARSGGSSSILTGAIKWWLSILLPEGIVKSATYWGMQHVPLLQTDYGFFVEHVL